MTVHEKSAVCERLPPLVSAQIKPACEICVIIPVRDEAETIGKTLRYLSAQKDLDGTTFASDRYEIILLINNCRDASARLAREFAARHPHLNLHIVEIQLSPTEAHVGRARRILMDEAQRRLNSLDRQRGVIASTDADTRVANDWLAQTLREIACGADAVGGRILLDEMECLKLPRHARRYHFLDAAYRLFSAELSWHLDPSSHDPLPRHHQHFGASLAVTTKMYEMAGRLPAIPALEDIAFYHALLRVGGRFRHSPRVRVVTSPRLIGRVAVGLSFQLREWAALGDQSNSYLVEPIASLEMKASIQRRLRRVASQWRSDDAKERADLVATLARDAGTTTSELGMFSEQAADNTCAAFVAIVFENLERNYYATGFWRARYQLVPIERAIKDLRFRLAPLRQTRPAILSDISRELFIAAPGEEIEPVEFGAQMAQMA